MCAVSKGLEKKKLGPGAIWWCNWCLYLVSIQGPWQLLRFKGRDSSPKKADRVTLLPIGSGYFQAKPFPI